MYLKNQAIVHIGAVSNSNISRNTKFAFASICVCILTNIPCQNYQQSAKFMHSRIIDILSCMSC